MVRNRLAPALLGAVVCSGPCAVAQELPGTWPGLDVAALTAIGGSAEDVAAQRAALHALGRVNGDRQALIALAPLLQHEDPRVRARIAARVRSVLSLPVPLGVLSHAVTDPAWIVTALPDLGEATVVRVVVPAVGVHGPYVLPEPLIWGDAPERRIAMTDVAREALREALMAVVTAPRVAWSPDPRAAYLRPPAHYAADARHDERQQAAAGIARLGGPEPLRLWLDAHATRRVEVALPVLDALTGTRANAQELLAELARVVRSADEVVAAAAADALVAGSRGSVSGEGRRALEARALRILRARLRGLTYSEHQGPMCGTGPEPLGPPADPGSRLVRAACAGGAVGLVDPLLGELRAATGEGRPNAPPMHDIYLLDALGRLAPHLPPESAAALFDALVDRGAADVPGRGGRADQLVGNALGRLACTVPEDRLPRLAELLRDRSLAMAALAVLHDPPRLDPDRARWIVDTWPRDVMPLAPAVLLAAPDRLLAALDGEADEASAAEHALVVACETDPERVRSWLDSGGLRPERFADAVARLRTPDPVLLVGLARLGSDVGAGFCEQVMAFGSEERDALVSIAAGEASALAVAAAVRLSSMGEESHRRSIVTLEGLVGSEDAAVRGLALRGALRAGVFTPAILDAARAARESSQWDERVAGLAVRLRVGEVTVEEVIGTSNYPIDVLREAQLEVGAEVFRRAARDDVTTGKRAIGGRSPPGLRAVLLEAAVGDPVWTAALESMAVYATADPDARVRRAAYRVLAAADPRGWPVAVLAHEAVLDDDPSVRAVAPR